MMMSIKELDLHEKFEGEDVGLNFRMKTLEFMDSMNQKLKGGKKRGYDKKDN